MRRKDLAADLKVVSLPCV